MNHSEAALSRKQLGAAGERHAELYLEEAGYRIIARNWRCRSGEIDLIAREGDILVVVEVRTRSSKARFGTPQESIDARKQQQVMETAQVYLYQQRLHNYQVRFDVISVFTDKQGNMKDIEHIRCAF